MDESTLEEQMCAWLWVSANGRTLEGAREGVRRFLQLARREGYVEGCEDEHGSFPIAPAADAFVRAALSKYPIRRTVTKPSVYRLEEGLWARGDGEGGVFFFPDEKSAEAFRGPGDVSLCVGRIGLRSEWLSGIVSAAKSPTITYEVEE
jgi:hypothetical protein